MDELQARMSHAEFVEWSAFAETEPLPASRSDIQTAMLMLLLYKGFTGKKGKKLKLRHFIPDWWQDKRSPRALAAKFRAMTAQLDEEEPEEKPVRGEPDDGHTGVAGRQAGARR